MIELLIASKMTYLVLVGGYAIKSAFPVDLPLVGERENAGLVGHRV